MKDEKAENVAKLSKEFTFLTVNLLKNGIELKRLRSTLNKKRKTDLTLKLSVSCLFLAIVYNSVLHFAPALFGIRCLIPNNYFIWEATRPISDCRYCIDVDAPVVLHNATREEFAPYAYTSKPVLIKEAVTHWPAFKTFDFDYFKKLYERTEDSIQSVNDECQFLHFKSNFISLKDVFDMPQERVSNAKGAKSWYVGWGNCHPVILKEMRSQHPKPHFLPEDCEIPSKEYVFMGYDDGATMHLDFINRLMWQAQLKGTKTWDLLPSNECEHVCHSVSFVAEAGDAVLVDTRVWYHGTTINPGEFSLSVQSEYG